MSMPSSSELVATTAGSRPALSSLSVRVRSARLIEPWCARARIVAASRVSTPTEAPDWACTDAGCRAPGSGSSSPERSAQTSFMRDVRRSAPRRELVKTSVDRWSATRSTTRSSTCGQIDARRVGAMPSPVRSSTGSSVAGPPSSVRSGTGTTTSTSIRFCEGGCTTRTARPPSSGRRAPPRNEATASTGRTVADSPTRCTGPGPPGRSSSASSLSSDRARCAPRLVPATAWISSRITVVTPDRPARAPDVRTRYRDSGVVMRMSGGCVAKARRSAGGVSPVRIPTVTSGSSSPSRVAACRIPTSGERRLRSTSVARALSGET